MKRKLLWLTAGGLSLTAVVLIAMNRQALAQQSGETPVTRNGGITVGRTFAPTPAGPWTPFLPNATDGPTGQTGPAGFIAPQASYPAQPPAGYPQAAGYPATNLSGGGYYVADSAVTNPPVPATPPTYGIRYGITGASPATKGYYQDEAKIQQLLAEYQSAKEDAVRTELVAQITKAVTNQFDEKQKAREQELKALEEQLAKLKEKHTKRQQLRNDIIGDRVSQLVNNIDGLGWGNETSGSLPPLAGGIGFPGLPGVNPAVPTYSSYPMVYPSPNVRIPTPTPSGVAPQWIAPQPGTQPATTVPAPPARAPQQPSQNNSTSVDPNDWSDAPGVRTRLLRDASPAPANASGLTYRRMQTQSQALTPSLGALPVAETQPLPSLDRLPNPLSDLDRLPNPLSDSAVEGPQIIDGVAPLEALQPTDPLIIAEQPTLELPVAPALPSADLAPPVESPELPPVAAEGTDPNPRG
jgi:hypothetical protein